MATDEPTSLTDAYAVIKLHLADERRKEIKDVRIVVNQAQSVESGRKTYAILQRACMIMWRRFDTYTSGSNFMAWASTVAGYEARNFRRASNRSRLHFSDALFATLAQERLSEPDQTDVRAEALGLIVALLITLVYTLDPTPYAMGAFTFVAQPLFGIVALGYIWRVIRDLKSKGLM